LFDSFAIPNGIKQGNYLPLLLLGLKLNAARQLLAYADGVNDG
jgi:hypothetical protein